MAAQPSYVQSVQKGNLIESGQSIPLNTNGPMAAVLMAYGGTVTLNETTPVDVANAAVTADSIIAFTLKTVGGTVGAAPVIATITPGTGFSVKGSASDTSIYNYVILG